MGPMASKRHLPADNPALSDEIAHSFNKVPEALPGDPKESSGPSMTLAL
jgi:hypothetical protein